MKRRLRPPFFFYRMPLLFVLEAMKKGADGALFSIAEPKSAANYFFAAGIS
jgi:hypothetical protein